MGIRKITLKKHLKKHLMDTGLTWLHENDRYYRFLLDPF